MTKLIYQCKKCDSQFPKWSGRCLECGAWGTLEKALGDNKKEDLEAPSGKVLEFSKINKADNLYQSTGIKELDRVLGKGVAKGALILLGGDPGIGKSTLALQWANNYSGSVLYVSAEESGAQVKGRLQRLGDKNKKLNFLGEEQVEVIAATIKSNKPDLVIIDSVQTVYCQEVAGELGGVNQIRAATIKFLELAKELNIPICLIGHVTKEGSLAGPKSLEHLVDVVLYLEGDQYQHYRLLRSVKNRFGSVKEVGVFEMEENGLVEVEDASKIFLQSTSAYPGSCLSAWLKGSRVFLIEVQALVSKTVFGYPVRKAAGFDNNRLQMLLAVLTKRLQLSLGQYDVYVNVIGGLKVNDPAIDLAVCLAIISAFSDKDLPEKLVALGEVGLGGEVRPVARLKERVKQIERLGYKNILSWQEAKNLKEIIKKI